MACTSTPRRDDINAQRIALGAVLGGGVGTIIGDKKGAVVGAMLGGLAGRLLASANIIQPDRKYINISATELYSHIIKTLTSNNFTITRSDPDDGIISAKYEKGVTKEFAIWKWMQNFTFYIELRPSLRNQNDVNLYYHFIVEEKPPLSSKYVAIEDNDSSSEMIKRILDEFDLFVSSKGGVY